MRKYWPADLHVIGKDICAFTPFTGRPFLMSAGLPLPKRVFGHGFPVHRGEKMRNRSAMSSRRENSFGICVDQVRYFFLREVPFGQDGNYSHEAIIAGSMPILPMISGISLSARFRWLPRTAVQECRHSAP